MANKYGPKARKKISRVMHEYGEGKLKAGRGRRGKVKSRKQAVAIAISEARKTGGKVPKRKKASKKSSRKSSRKKGKTRSR